MTSHFLYVRCATNINFNVCDVWCAGVCGMILSVCYEKLMRRRINQAIQTIPNQTTKKVSKPRRQYKHIVQKYVAAAAALIFTVCHFVHVASSLVSFRIQRRCLALLFG